jgi:uroporphyrinogen-III synthase
MSLAGRHVVVTRPAGQAAHFATALTEAGAMPVLYPVLEIRDVEDVAPLLDVAIRLDGFDLAVFVSPNAIERALNVILSRRCVSRRWARAANANSPVMAYMTSSRRRCASIPKPCSISPN